MARFAYIAVDPEGRERSGAVVAPSEAAARAHLEKKRLMPVRLTTADHAGARAPTADQARIQAQQAAAQPAGGARLSARDQMLIARQLATLIEASLPVDEALGLIAEQQEKASARRILSDVQEGVIEGQRLADAMGRHPRSFPGLFRAAVAGGERSGALGAILSRLADYLARAHALRTKIQTAMIYPTALSCVALLVIACLMIFVVPSLTEQFRAFNANLPLVTQILIGVSGFLAAFWPLIALALAGLFMMLRALFAQAGPALARDRALLSAPIFGKWIKTVEASRFARAASTLIAAGLPALDSVKSARDSVANRHIAGLIQTMAVRIEEGEPLSNAMRLSGAFPPIVAYMAASGESSGSLAMMLEKAADHLDQEFEAFASAAMSLFEPAVILVMGAVVAGIVLAIMLPILQLNQLAIG
jgi:general secretion pathway protein F